MVKFGKITNPITHSEDLKEAVRGYNNIVDQYYDKAAQLEKSAYVLYDMRKKCYRKMQELDSIIVGLDDAPEMLKKGSSRALLYANNIKTAWDIENQNNTPNIEKKSGSSSGVGTGGVAGMAAGVGLATGGPAAAMAIATTFGTASTGIAISALSGAAETAAALAWLGGGAVAAGGGGMALGQTVLRFMGPVGWGVAGAVGVYQVTRIRSKNDNKIKEINKEKELISTKFRELCHLHSRLRDIIGKTHELQESFNIGLVQNLKRYDESVLLQERLFYLVDVSKKLGKLSNESVNINSK